MTPTRSSGHLDVLVNNAGISGAQATTTDTGPDDVRAVYDTNVFGPVRVTRAMVPLLERSTAPRIENSVSGLAYQSSPVPVGQGRPR